MRRTSAKFFAIIFSIMMVVSVAVLPTVVHAVGETALEQEALGKVSSIDLVNCGGFWNRLTVSCIVPQLTYYVLYIPAMSLLALSGYIFDFVLSLSIDHTFINQAFVGKLWGIIRDFSNMLFIFVLLYTGIQTIFGLGKWQGTIIKVIVVALLVNFSMFFTKVVIDAGNILAVGVYQSIGVTKVAGIDRPHKTTAMGDVPERTVSATLVNALNPQQFSKLSADNKSGAVTIFIISAIVCAYAAFVFIKVAMLFIGRILAFWFLIAISPFALISMSLPKYNVWGWWTNTLINQSFVAPVFLVLVYFILAAIEGLNGVLTTNSASDSYFDKIVIPIVVTAMVVYALKRALGVAEGMSGKFGEIGADALGKAMSSFPMGMALGGGAMLLRSSIGSRAGKLLQSGGLQKMSSDPNSGFTRFMGRTLHGVADKAHTSTFDARNTDTMKWAVKNAKSAFDVKMDLGKGGGKGGYKATMEKLEKDAKAQAEKMKVTSAEKATEAAKMDPRYSEAKAKEEEYLNAQTRTTIAHGEAKGNLENTNEWKEYKNLEENIKTTKSNFSSTSGNLEKKIADLKKKQAEAGIVESKKVIQEEIDKADNELTQARNILTTEEKKLADAKDAYNATAEAKFLAEALVAKDIASGAYKNAQEIIKEAEKAAGVWEDQENRQRRGFSAENSMNSLISSNRYFVSKADRTSVVKKIRKGDDKEKKRLEKMMKDWAKYVNTQQEKEEKGEEEIKVDEEKKE